MTVLSTLGDLEDDVLQAAHEDFEMFLREGELEIVYDGCDDDDDDEW